MFCLKSTCVHVYMVVCVHLRLYPCSVEEIHRTLKTSSNGVYGTVQPLELSGRPWRRRKLWGCCISRNARKPSSSCARTLLASERGRGSWEEREGGSLGRLAVLLK